MTQILVFGDSITHGFWDEEGGWVQRLRKYLDKKAIDDHDLYFAVYNLGISGDTSEGILNRFEFETRVRLNLKDDGEEIIILISIGVNDSIYNNKTKRNLVPLKDYSSNVLKLIKLAEKYTNNIIFVSECPVDQSKVDPIPWRDNSSYKEKHIEDYYNSLTKICNNKGILLIDVYKAFKKIPNYQRLLIDGVHPLAEGHKLIFELVRDSLIKEKII